MSILGAADSPLNPQKPEQSPDLDHTAGPWCLSPNGTYVRYEGPHGPNVCDLSVFGGPPHEAEGNARLIVAAPALALAWALVPEDVKERIYDFLDEHFPAEPALSFGWVRQAIEAIPNPDLDVDPEPQPELVAVECAPMMLLPAAPDKCQECAVKHEPQQPHDAQSLYYQTQFNMKHGRAATWADAMAHCDENLQRLWRQELANEGVPESQLRPVVAITIDTQGAL